MRMHGWMEWLLPRLRDPAQRERLLLNASLGFNLVYAGFNLIMGAWYQSFWMIGLGGYYGLLAIMRFLLYRKLRREGDRAGWRVYRQTAVLLLILTLIISGIVGETYVLNRTFDYPGVLVYAFAAFAFGKIISVTAALIRKRHEENRVLAAARCVSFAHALMSILALQISLIHRFGADDPGFARLMNGVVGGVICALVVGMAAFMLWKADRHMGNGIRPGQVRHSSADRKRHHS